MEIVVPKLCLSYWTVIDEEGFVIGLIRGGAKPHKEGAYPADFRRAVVELVAKLQEEKEKNDGRS